MDFIKTLYKTVFCIFYKNQIPEVSTFLFVQNDYSYFIDRRQIFPTSIYIFFQYKLHLKIEDNASSALQLSESLLYSYIDLNERVIILEV